MPLRLEAWLERLGAYIGQHGWCDPSGVSIVPDAGDRVHESAQGWTTSIQPVADHIVPGPVARERAGQPTRHP